MRDPSTKDGDEYSGGSMGGARGAHPPLFFDQTEARRGEKFFLETGSPPPLYLRVWMTGLPRYLKVWVLHWCKGYQTAVPKKFLRRLSTKVGDVQGF